MREILGHKNQKNFKKFSEIWKKINKHKFEDVLGKIMNKF